MLDMATWQGSQAAPQSAEAGWSATRQGRAELAAAGLFVIAIATVPLLCQELYPFSRAPMFADAPQCYYEYTVLDPAGKALDLQSFGLQRNYWGNPLGVGVGFQPPESLDLFDRLASREALSGWIQERLARFPRLEYVVVAQRQISSFDDRSVGEMKHAAFLVPNPSFRSAAK
jgi:hypothetical protein